MIDTSKKFTNLVILLFIVLNLLSCQQNTLTTSMPTSEALLDKLTTDHFEPSVVAETPSATPSPSLDKMIEK